MIFYIARHGVTEWNKVKRMQGQTDIPLAQEGIMLAKECGQNMLDLPIDLVISSPLQRAYDTAQLMLAGRDIEIKKDDRLKEICFGDWEGELIFESKILPAQYRELFYRDPLNCQAPPNGESFEMVCDRTRELFLELIKNAAYQDKHILISSHGAASRCFLRNFFEDKEDIWRGGVPKNCAVTIAEYRDGKAKVLELDHLFYEE